MSDNANTESAAGGAQNNTQSNAGQNAPSPQPPAQNHAPSPAMPDFSKLTETLNALPESIARSVKEAVGTPTNPTPAAPSTAKETDSADSKKEEKGTDDDSTSRAKPSSVPGSGEQRPNRFANWWFS